MVPFQSEICKVKPLHPLFFKVNFSQIIPNGAGFSIIFYVHPASPQARLMQWLTHKANPSTASMLLPPFLTVILFVAMLTTFLTHCLFRFPTQPKSQAITSLATKRRCTSTTTFVLLVPV